MTDEGRQLYAPELPGGVLVKIFSGLASSNPDSVRDLCAAASVCPSWREAAKEPCLWHMLSVREAPLNARLTGPRLRNLIARSCNTLSWLLLVGCPLVNDVMLALPLQQQPCLLCVSVTDCALVTRPGLAYALCDAEDFQGIVEQLKNPRQSAADAQRCCVALRTLLDAAEDDATLPEARAGALDALLHCANKHTAHAGVQDACCWALSEYVCVAEDTDLASYPPTFQAAVAALKAHPLYCYVQGPALFAVYNVCFFGLAATHGVPALLDAIQPVLAALRAFPTDLEVQLCGCSSLTLMCGMDASVAEAVAAAGALGLFIKALNLDVKNEVALSAAIDAIGAIALSKAALPQASACISALLSALRRYEKISGVAVAACKTLGCYLRCPATRQRALLSWADSAIRATCTAHSTNEAVKKAAADALKAPHA